MSTAIADIPDTKELAAAFWNEFHQVEAALAPLAVREKFDALNKILEKYFTGIAVELLSNKDGSIGTLCFSAHGKAECFPPVMELVAQAPVSNSYKVTALHWRERETITRQLAVAEQKVTGQVAENMIDASLDRIKRRLH